MDRVLANLDWIFLAVAVLIYLRYSLKHRKWERIFKTTWAAISLSVLLFAELTEEEKITVATKSHTVWSFGSPFNPFTWGNFHCRDQSTRQLIIDKYKEAEKNVNIPSDNRVPTDDFSV